LALEQYQVIGPQRMAFSNFDAFSPKNVPNLMTYLTTFRGVTWIDDRNMYVNHG